MVTRENITRWWVMSDSVKVLLGYAIGVLLTGGVMTYSLPPECVYQQEVVDDA